MTCQRRGLLLRKSIGSQQAPHQLQFKISFSNARGSFVIQKRQAGARQQLINVQLYIVRRNYREFGGIVLAFLF